MFFAHGAQQGGLDVFHRAGESAAHHHYAASSRVTAVAKTSPATSPNISKAFWPQRGRPLLSFGNEKYVVRGKTMGRIAGERAVFCG